MFCLDNFSLHCIIKMLNFKVNDPLMAFRYFLAYHIIWQMLLPLTILLFQDFMDRNLVFHSCRC